MLYKGGHKVAQGMYWDVMTGDRIDVTQEAVLPGETKKTYMKASAGVMLLAAPVIGLVFAVFLPFIGILMATGQLLKKVAGTGTELAAKSMSFGWKPIEAYLSGRKNKKDAGKKDARK